MRAAVSPRNIQIVVLAVFLLLAAPLAGRSAGGNMALDVLSPGESGNFAVDESELESRLLAWSYFLALAERKDVMIIDVRSGFFPAGDPPGLKNVRPIPLEIFLRNFVARKVHQDKTLLILDQSGNELRRLQFHLTKHGYDDYFFLDSGAAGAMNRRQGGS